MSRLRNTEAILRLIERAVDTWFRQSLADRSFSDDFVESVVGSAVYSIVRQLQSRDLVPHDFECDPRVLVEDGEILYSINPLPPYTEAK